MSTRALLMIPGPVECDPEVLAAAGAQSDSHLGPPMTAAVCRVLRNLREVFQTHSAQPFVLAGSGTLALECGIANLVEPGDRVLVVNTGYFSERAALIAERYGCQVQQVRARLGRIPSLEAVEDALTGGRFKLVCITQVDTSTGALAPVEEICRAASQRGALTLVDAVCATGGEALRQDSWNVDVVVTASQKALAVPSGLAIVSASERALEVHKARRNPVGSFYCDWANWLPVFQGYARGEPRYFATPPVNLFHALDVSLQQILAEGVELRFQRHREMAKALRAAWRALRLEPVMAAEQEQANTLSALYYPEGLELTLIDRIRDEGVIVAGGLLPEIKGRYFRVGHMGNLRESEVLAAAAAIGHALVRAGQGVDPAAAVAAAEEVIGKEESAAPETVASEWTIH